MDYVSPVFVQPCTDSFTVSPGLPHVHFLCGVTEVLKLERWVFKSGGGLHLSRQQLPLKLAWAISIHKSQVGIVLENTETNAT